MRAAKWQKIHDFFIIIIIEPVTGVMASGALNDKCGFRYRRQLVRFNAVRNRDLNFGNYEATLYKSSQVFKAPTLTEARGKFVRKFTYWKKSCEWLIFSFFCFGDEY